MKLVYAKRQFATTLGNGQVIRVLPGEAWDATSELVKNHPDAFAEIPDKARTDTGWVETATAAPGEKRKR